MNRQHIVSAFKAARREEGIKHDEQSKFGDCGPLSRRLKRILQERHGYDAKLKHGTFVCGADNNSEDEDAVIEYDHTWLEVEGYTVDGTIDQFFSDLDEDMVTVIDGLYFSHPSHDGDRYKDRYRARDYAAPPVNPER